MGVVLPLLSLYNNILIFAPTSSILTQPNHKFFLSASRWICFCLKSPLFSRVVTFCISEATCGTISLRILHTELNPASHSLFLEYSYLYMRAHRTSMIYDIPFMGPHKVTPPPHVPHRVDPSRDILMDPRSASNSVVLHPCYFAGFCDYTERFFD